MLIFYREMVTNGDPEKVLPLVQEIASLAKRHDVPVNAWQGSNGHVLGTIAFSVRYESLSARATAGARLYGDKLWPTLSRRLSEVLIGTPGPDLITNVVRGGDGNQEIPVGTVVTQNQFQLARSDDFLKAMAWANEMADMVKLLIGVDPIVGHTLYGPLGGIGLLNAYPNFAEVDQAVAKLLTSNDYMTKYLESGKFALPGSATQRQIIKIA